MTRQDTVDVSVLDSCAKQTIARNARGSVDAVREYVFPFAVVVATIAIGMALALLYYTEDEDEED